jgi:DNA-binding winged helix-turn-helix (wHTH) protein/Tol biopolymer transport system component
VGQPVSAPAKYRFGTFELDRATAELRKRSIRIKLQEQPYRILCLLLDSPGEVILRDTLSAALWPEDTFVEFEQSLNAAVAKLRQALGDSAENPRYVETVPRRGYRFIAPVEAIAFSEPAADLGPQRPILAEHDQPVVDHAPVPQPSAWKRHKKLVLGAAVAGVIVGAAIAVTLLRHSNAISAPEITRVTFDSGLTTDPALSPDGKLLGYASDRDGSGRLHIWVQQFISNGQAMQLTRGDAEDHQPAFSPDGSKLVFRSERDGGGIYVIPAIGGEATLLAQAGRDPRFSPDGRWIAYWVGVNMGPPFVANAGTVYVVPSTGGTPQPVRSDLTEAGNPVWSWDGTRLIVYGYKVDGPSTSDWWVVPVQGGSATPTGAFPRFRKKGFTLAWRDEPRVANWSGNELLFSARVGDSVNLWKIHIGSSDPRVTGNPQRLTSGTELEVYPSLTADGRLVFASLTNSLNVWTLPVVDASSGTVVGQSRRATEAIGPHQYASLSVDGKLLAYSSVRYGHPHVWIKDFQSGKESPLTSTGPSEHGPQLSSDGSLVTFISGDRRTNGFVVPVRGGVADQFCTDCASPYDLI